MGDWAIVGREAGENPRADLKNLLCGLLALLALSPVGERLSGPLKREPEMELPPRPELVFSSEAQQAPNLIIVDIPQEQRLVMLTKILNSQDSGGILALAKLVTANGNLLCDSRPLIIEESLARFLYQESRSAEGEPISAIRVEKVNDLQLVAVNEGETPQAVARRRGWTEHTVVELNSVVVVPHIPFDRTRSIILPQDDQTRWIITGASGLPPTLTQEQVTRQTQTMLEKSGALQAGTLLGVELGTSGLGTKEAPATAVLLASPCLRNYNRATRTWSPVVDRQATAVYAGLFEGQTLLRIPLNPQKGERAEIYQGKDFPGPAIVIKDRQGKNVRLIDLRTGTAWEWGKWPKPTPTATPTPEPTPTPTPVCGELTLKPGESAYIRTGPGTNYSILETFDPGEKFLVKYQAPGGGWMFGDLLGPDGQVKRVNVWVTGSEKYVVITCGKAGIPVIPKEQIPPTPTPKATPTPRPTETPKPAEMVFQGNGWKIDNRYPEMVEVGINPSFVPRLEELMRQYNTPTLEFIIFKECPVEMGAGQGLYCVGLTSTGEWGCPCRVLSYKGKVLLYPEPGGVFDLLRRRVEEAGYPPERYYASWLTTAITGSKGPDTLPLLDELLSRKAVIVKLNYLGK